MSRALMVVVAGVIALSALRLSAADEPIDWQRAQQLHRRATNGEKLSPDEQAYYDRAKRERSRQAGGGNAPGGQSGVPAARETTGLVPLTELGSEKYKDQDGGLYGNGQNEPPAEQRQRLTAASKLIVPRDASVAPDPAGKVVLLSIGMSNTTQEFSKFKQLAEADASRSPRVVVVDGAQGGQTGIAWASGKKQRNPEADKPWGVLDERLKRADVTPGQVQVIWIKMAESGPASHGDFPAHAKVLQESYVTVLGKLRERFPNLQVAYLSNRIYAGYATTGLNPEPYAYESAFAVRGVIQQQMAGDAALNCDPKNGTVRSPALAWGPYLWADGTKPRQADKLVWLRDDLSGDGTHPSDTGREKVARLLLGFFQNDPFARSWYLASAN